MKVSAELCVSCKGTKALCGWRPCPLLSRLSIQSAPALLKDSFSGPSASVFVGSFGYPDVSIGPLAGIAEDVRITDNPSKWYGLDYSNIIKMRSSILRSRTKENIFSHSAYVETVQELALAKAPVSVDMLFKNRPIYRVTFSSITQPMGPTALLKKLTVTENISVEQKVEKIVTDDLLANEQASLLFGVGQDVYNINSIMSAGLLGQKKKIVPTRWSITAVDDLLCKSMLGEVREFNAVNEFLLYSGEFLGNHFEILLMPGRWEFENFESWAPGSIWAQNASNVFTTEEYEPHDGRKKYADKQVGGYYAVRFGVVEALMGMRRQARVLSIREISEKYIMPLGVWVVRETVRNAMKSKPIKFSSLGEALEHMEKKLRVPVHEYRRQSRLLQQRRLSDF